MLPADLDRYRRITEKAGHDDRGAVHDADGVRIAPLLRAKHAAYHETALQIDVRTFAYRNGIRVGVVRTDEVRA